MDSRDNEEIIYDQKDVYSLHFPDGTSESMISIDETHFSMDFLLERKVPNLVPLIRNAWKLPCRKDDIFICAFMKAGTHWVWEICKMLLSGTTNYDPDSKEKFMLEFRTTEQLDSVASPRLLNTHLLPRQLPTSLQNNQNKVILIQRNPKDIAVSHYHHLTKLHYYKCSFSAYLPVFLNKATLFHNWFDYTNAWEEALSSIYKDTPILQLYYEDLQRDGLKNIRRISDFLELGRDEDFIRQVNTCCGFDEMKHNKLAMAKARNDQMQTVMYRKGKIGDWKNWFTVTESENFDNIYHSRMKGSNFSYTWE